MATRESLIATAAERRENMNYSYDYAYVDREDHTVDKIKLQSYEFRNEGKDMYLFSDDDRLYVTNFKNVLLVRGKEV